MTDMEKKQIVELRTQGYGYATIAKTVGIKKDTVVAFCRKHGLTGVKAADNSRTAVNADFCKNCGSVLHQQDGRKKKKFCCPDCRVTWWNSHPENVKRRAVYSFVCACCGKPFTAYGNANRKYCSHSCYIMCRFQGGECHE